MAAILAANNLRDVVHDGEAKVTTMARVLGAKGGRAEYVILVVGAYGIIAGLVIARVLSPWTLLVLISSPLAVKNLRSVLTSRPGEAEDLATADVTTAQLHMAFGLLLTLGVILGASL